MNPSFCPLGRATAPVPTPDLPEPYHPDPVPGPDRPIVPDPVPSRPVPPTEPYRPAPIGTAMTRQLDVTAS